LSDSVSRTPAGITLVQIQDQPKSKLSDSWVGLVR
jgi:hypothetical protein